MDRFLKTAVNIVTQNQLTVQCEILRNNGQVLEDSSEHSDTEPIDLTVSSTGSEQNVQYRFGYSDTEPTDGTFVRY